MRYAIGDRVQNRFSGRIGSPKSTAVMIADGECGTVVGHNHSNCEVKMDGGAHGYIYDGHLTLVERTEYLANTKDYADYYNAVTEYSEEG